MLSPSDIINRMPLSHKVALSLLQVGLNIKDGFDTSAIPVNDENFWNELHRFSAVQGISALTFESLRFLGLEAHMPKSLKISWTLESEKAIRKYRHFSKTAPELEKFFSPSGLIPVHMKGLSMSLLYPRPELRECGDYDFYLYKISENPDKQDILINSQEGEAFVQAAGYDIDSILTEKHSCWDFRHIHVECHRFLLNLQYVPESASPVEQRLHQHMAPVRTILADGGEIHCVSPEFALMFVPFHALQHSGCGLRLRHIADWAMLSRKYGNDVSRYDFSECLRGGVNSLNVLSNKTLATDFKTDGNARLASQMLKAVLQPGEYERLDINNETLHDIPGRLRKFARRNKLAHKIFPDYPPLVNSIFNALMFKLEC